MEKFMEVSNQTCPNCGASISVRGHEETVQCEYCNSKLSVLLPIMVSAQAPIDSTLDEQKRFKNFVSILQQAMAAGNYREGYEYCNKALEINPNASEIWENKAICSFWLSTKRDIVEDQAKEVLTYLAAAERCDADSQTLPLTSKHIAENLFSISKFWLLDTEPDICRDNEMFFSEDLVRRLYAYVCLWPVAFEIHPDLIYLKEVLHEFSGGQKLNWKGNKSVPWQKKREVVIKMIQQREPSYQPPAVKSNSCFVATATMGDINHPYCKELRVFRDQVLNNTLRGRKFIYWYYKEGPKLANIIAASRPLRLLSYYFIVKPSVFISRYFIK